MKIIIGNIILFAGYALLVAFFSLRPNGAAVVGSYDKLAHFLVYALFASLAYRLRLANRTYAYLCLGIVLYSGLLEFGQSFVPGRQMSALDLLANGLGVALGALVCRAIFPARNHTSNFPR